MTIVSWLMATRRPRRSAGATSEMYIGEMFEAKTDAHPAQDSPGHEHREGVGQGDAQRGDDKVESGNDQDRLPAEAVAGPAGHERAAQAASNAQLWAQPTGDTRVHLHLHPERSLRRHIHGRVLQLEEGLVEFGPLPRSPPSRSRTAGRPKPPRSRSARHTGNSVQTARWAGSPPGWKSYAAL